MINIVCVLKKPSNFLTYDSSWVQKLKRGVERNITTKHKFFCLSDMDIPNVDVIPLQNNWMMYWSKIEIFRPNLFQGPTLYIDIDSMITNNIDALLTPIDGMIMLTDFYPWFKNSGLMFWDASNPLFGELYTRMIKDPMSIMIKHRYKGANNYGDQEYIANTVSELGIPIYEWQKIKPVDWFLEFSFENHLNPVVNNPSPNTKICYCLGSPKFDNFSQIPLVSRNWI